MLEAPCIVHDVQHGLWRATFLQCDQKFLPLRCSQGMHRELRELQRRGALPPPGIAPRPGEDRYDSTTFDDRLISEDRFDFTRSAPIAPPPGEINAHIHKCPGRRQGKSGFAGRCEIFNEFELHFQVRCKSSSTRLPYSFR